MDSYAVTYQKKPSVFRRLARQLRSSVDLRPEEIPAVPPKADVLHIHVRSKAPAPLTLTPDWLSAPVNSRGVVQARAPPLSPCPSTASKPRRRTLSKAASLFNEGGKKRASFWKKGSSAGAATPRCDSAMSFASADAFARSPAWDQDSGCFSSPISPVSPQSASSAQRRARSSSDSTILPVASDFGSPSSRSPAFRRAHRTKISDSSIESMDTVESEILHITAQMERSAISAMRSRPTSIRLRRSFETSQRPVMDEMGWI